VTEISPFIAGMPKAELHVHLEGTLEPELKFQLAARNHMGLPYRSAVEMRAAYNFGDLPSFLAMYYEGMAVLQTEEDFYDLAMAYFRKARSQNVVYAEVFFDPQAHTARGIPFETVISGFGRAQQDAAAGLGLDTQLIMCFLRDMTAESALETLARSLPYRDRIVGVGLDSDERGNPPVKFQEVFDRARSEGYRLTMHCDVDQEDSVAHIWQCLNEIGVERIDHGVNCLEDDTLVDRLTRSGVGLTVCPISNSYVSDGLKAPEIKAMLDRSLRVTVNSDDPAYFPGYIGENLAAVAEAVNLTQRDLVQIERNAFTIAWITDEARAGYLRDLDAYAPD
jgi:adenosine deaminase